MISRPKTALLSSSSPSDLRSGTTSGITDRRCLAKRSKPPGKDDDDGGYRAAAKEEGVEVVGSLGALVLPHMRFRCPEVIIKKRTNDFVADGVDRFGPKILPNFGQFWHHIKSRN